MQRRRSNLRLTAAALAFAAAAPAFARDAVHATQRIREGDTILRERLRMAPSTSDAASTFGRRGSAAGRVALRDIEEGEALRRDAVGDVPSRQFRIGDATPVRVVFERFEGAVVQGARIDQQSCTFDTATLSAAHAAALRSQLKHSALLFAPESAFEIATGGGVEYRVRITVGATTKTAHWTNDGAPDSVQPLVQWLQACETPR